MIVSTEYKGYQKLTKKGNGSILKAIRASKGGGVGLMAAGIFLLVCALLFLSILFGILGIALLVVGIVLKNKRSGSWISYYTEATGYSESEIMEIDRELVSHSTALLLASLPGGNEYIACFFTEHYMVMNNVNPYVRRLEDFIAMAYSDSSDIWGLSILTKQDKETLFVGLNTAPSKKEALCAEITQELCRRNPNILCGQLIACEGKRYILERDGAELLRLYQEGRKLETIQ